MDYHKIYNHFYAKAFNASRKIIISKFKKAKAKNRPFHKFGNDIGRDLRQYRIEKFEKKLKDKAAQSFAIFNNKYEYVVGERDVVIRQILEEEVFDVFDASKSYPYAHFIADLAVEDCLKEVGRHYHNHYSFYEIIYDLGRYDYFYLKDFNDGNYENSKAYQEMLDIKYPYRIEERIEREKVIAQEKSNEVNEKNKGVDKASRPSSEKKMILELVSIFDDNERGLLISAFYEQMEKNNLSEMHLPELMKLFKIIGLYNDLTIFDKSYKNKSFYSKANKGLNYYEAMDSKLDLINSTILKLEKIKMKFMINILKSKKLNLV